MARPPRSPSSPSPSFFPSSYPISFPSITSVIYTSILLLLWSGYVESRFLPTNGTMEMRKCEGNETNCAVHVFRVVLSQKPTEDGNFLQQEVEEIPLKPAKKYGSNVYTVVGNPNLRKKITDRIPKDMDPNLRNAMKEAIENDQYLLKDTDSPRSSVPSVVVERPVRTESIRAPGISSLPDDSFTLSVTIGLVVLGVLVGIALTFVCIFLLEYRAKPMFDRSSVVTFRRACNQRSALSRRLANVQPTRNAAGERVLVHDAQRFFMHEYSSDDEISYPTFRSIPGRNDGPNQHSINNGASTSGANANSQAIQLHHLQQMVSPRYIQATGGNGGRRYLRYVRGPGRVERTASDELERAGSRSSTRNTE